MASWLQRKARQVFTNSLIGKLLKATKPPKPLASGQKKRDKLPATVRELLSNYSASEFGQFVRDLQSAVQAGEKKEVQQFLTEMGPLGGVVASLLEDSPTGVPKDVHAAIEFAKQFVDRPEVLAAFKDVAMGQGEETTDTPKEAQKRRQQEQIATPGSRPNGYAVDLGDGRRTRFPPDHPLLTGDMVDAPKSSNVHSFGYDLYSHSLYVRYLDHESDEGKTSRRPGPIYRYFNAPPELFLAFLRADSKGSFVWDSLRIRGTVSGHQLDYALVGVQNGYVPRKATMTPHGEAFIPRTVFSDRERRLTSTRGFEIVRPMIPKPRDGRPNTGQP